MRRIRIFVSGLSVNKHLVQWVTTVLIMVNLGLGTAIIVGGVERFSPPSYNPLIAYSHGHTWIWGVWIALAGILMAAPFKWVNIIGLWLAMFWNMIWQACFIIAVVHYEGAAVTPIPVYGGFALITAGLLTARVIQKPEE